MFTRGLHRIGKPAVLTLALLAPLAAATSAQAAGPVPFTITEDIDFESQVFTFNATGPLCPSGTFEDEVLRAAGRTDVTGKANLLIRTVYTCDDGSGTFNALKHVFITVVSDESSTNTGPIQLHDGTGAFTGLSGHGVDTGASEGPIAHGEISGFVVQR
jgi:hypothetical protein